MKTLSKLLSTLILFSLSNILFAQQIQILVVGSSHENKPGAENYEMVIEKLKNFQPDMLFGEYLSPADYNALAPGSYAFEGLKKAKKLVASGYALPVKNLEKKITSASKSLYKFPYYHKLRMDLASHYVMQGDRGNAEYQFYLIEHHMKKAFGKDEQAYYQAHFGNLNSIKNARLYRPLSEYTNIYFPLLYTLKQNKIYPMDCQKYDLPWSAAWGRADSAYQVLKAKAKGDTASAEAKTYAAIQKYSDLTEDDKKRMTPSPYFNMAHDRYSELNDAWNFYGGSHFYGWAGFPENDVRAMIKQWNLRNEGMCANVLKQAKEQKATKVIVGVGAAHRKLMEDILSRDPDVKIVSYADLM